MKLRESWKGEKIMQSAKLRIITAIANLLRAVGDMPEDLCTADIVVGYVDRAREAVEHRIREEKL